MTMLNRQFAPVHDAASGRPAYLQRKCACGASAPEGEVCEQCKDKLQARLAVGAVDDPLEHEADRMADRVAAPSALDDASTAPSQVQRAGGASTDATGSAPPSVERTLAQGGRPLEPALRQDMEQHFGHDFTDVRVHDDGPALASARDVNARAYTAGRHIVFAAGQYSPDTQAGRHLLAHELAHVLQQGAATPVVRTKPEPKDAAAKTPAAKTPAAKGAKPAVQKVCGRDPRKVKGNWITAVRIDVGTNVLTIDWKDPKTAPALSKGTHAISPGAGLCCVDCNDEKESQTSGSLCTPKGGSWKVSGIACALGGHPGAKNPAYFQRSGVAIHSGNTKSPPQSHGCARTAVEISELIHDNVVIDTTEIVVGGTWAGTQCYKNAKTDVLSSRKDVCGGGKKKKQEGTQGKKAAVVPDAEEVAPEPVDGPGPNNEPASEEGAGDIPVSDVETDETADEGASAVALEATPAEAAPAAKADEAGGAPVLQAKLAVGSVDDPLEHEADRIADRVLSSAAPGAAVQAPVGGQRASGEAEGALQSAPASVERVLAASGRPLAPAVRHDMAQRFGHDFSDVRVHDDAPAHASARDVGARAYTSGQHIVFGAGRYAATPEGRRLLAHELAHTLQQVPASRLQRQAEDALEDEEGPLEQEAEDAAGSTTVQTIVLDPASRRTRFYTIGGKTYDGKIDTLNSTFPQGDYLLKRSKSKDPYRVWDVFFSDGGIYHGGLQFHVTLANVRFESLDYTATIKLTVASSLLPTLIDIEARIRMIKAQVIKPFVNEAEEKAILALFEDVPPEQAGEFIRQLRGEQVGSTPLLERLDKDVDGENNIALHQHLSRLKLQGGGAKAARALADAPQLAWHDVMGFFEQTAVFSVTPTGKGKYRIRYLGGVTGGLLSSPEYAEIQDLGQKKRLELMTAGIEVDADQPIIVHDYDNDRHVVLTAEDLVAYQHAGVRKFLQDVGTIASLATPAGAETAGARVLAYSVQIASLATAIVDENKLNIRKWFPNWGPAIIDASEKLKIAIAVFGVVQLVKGSWKLFANLRRLRSARAAMDAKAVASNAEEMALAEKQAAALEANADQLLAKADLARKELGLAEDLAASGKSVEAAAPGVAGAGAVVMSPASKTRIIEAAIGKGDFAGEFSALVNQELGDAVKNRSRVRPARISGYSVEVAIEGTEHFLARNAKGGWCLFSGSARGCGALGVAATVDELFAEISRELGLKKTVRIGTAGRVDLAAAVSEAEGVAVDLKVQPHDVAREVRGAQGVSGKDVQSAHHAPSSAVKGRAGYSRGGALTVLLPRATHKAFDDFWAKWAIAQRKAGETQVTVGRFVEILDKAIGQTPNLDAKAKGAMSWIMQNEFYRDLGLQSTDLLDLPFPNIKPSVP